MSEVTTEDAKRFLGEACRNWSYLRFNKDDLEDVRASLQRYREAAVAELRAEVELVRGIAREAVLALSQHTSYGCPACPGDCASANPPVMVCPTQAALNAFAMWDAYQKETSHDD